MKKNIVYLLLFSFVVFMSGCGDSIYSDVDDTSSQASKQDKLDFDFIKGKCGSIIDNYDRIDETGAALSRDDVFKYISAILQCGGFDVINGINVIYETDTADIYNLVASMIGVDSATTDDLAKISSHYKKAVDICNVRYELANQDNTAIDDSMAAVCGFAGMVSSASNVSLLVGSFINRPVTISEEGLKEALRTIDIDTAVDNFLEKAENISYLDNLTVTINMAFEGILSMEDILDGSASMVQEIKDGIFDSNNQVSDDKLKSYIADMKNK